MGKTKAPKKSSKTESSPSPVGYRMSTDLGEGRRVQVGAWKDELRVDIRHWQPGSCGAPYPTRKGISLNLRQFKTLCEVVGEITNCLIHQAKPSFRIGRHIYVTPNTFGVNIRKWFIPAQNPQLILPSKFGVFLRRQQWTDFVNLVPDIIRAIPELGTVVTCRDDPDHAKDYVAMACQECNAFPLDVTRDTATSENDAAMSDTNEHTPSDSPASENPHSQSSSDAPKTFSCDICQKKFHRYDNLTRHIAVHNNPCNFHCSECGKSFIRYDAFQRHSEQHSASKRSHPDDDTSVAKKTKLDSFNITKTNHRNMHKFGTIIDNYNVTFAENDNVFNLAQVVDRLHRLFSELLDEIAGNGARSDRVQIVLETVDLDYPITLPFRQRHELSVDDILNQIELVIQSNEHFQLDSSVTIRVTQIHMPEGGKRRRGYVDFEKRLKTSKSILVIKNSDELCCARAIITAKAKLDRHESWNSIRQGRAIQKDLALELHRAAGVPLGKCGIDEVKLFQKVMPGYQITVLSKDHFDGIIFQGPSAEAKIYLYLHNGHYNVITSMPGFLNKSYYCHVCLKGYNQKENHKCNTVCKCCYKCHQSVGSWLYCKLCNRYFKGQECFDNHTASTTKGNSTCKKFFRCSDCSRVVNRTNRRKEDHHCGEKFCKSCHDMVRPDHLCYMKPYCNDQMGINENGEKGDDITFDPYLAEYGIYDIEPYSRDNEEEAEEPKRYIFYDFEAMQETGTHIPNLCVAHVVCELCIDEETRSCEKCGARERIFSGRDAATLFCQWLFSGKNNGATCICHNFKGYDSYFILDYCHNNGVLPDVIMNGAKIMSITVTQCDIKFIDSINFIPMALAKLPKTFGFSELKKGYFPHLYNTASNQDVVTIGLPPREMYCPDGMKPNDRAAFLQWYNDHENDDFDLQRELVAYCKSDVDILRRSCSKFRELFMSLTDIDPFLVCITIASACNLVFRSKFLEPISIGIIPTHGYKPEYNQSIRAMEWIKYISYSRNVNVKHAKNSGEKKIGPYLVDGYYETDNGDKIVLEFNGCFWHGCLTCYTSDTVNSVNDMTMYDLHKRTLDKKRYITNLGYTYEEIWECEWQRQIDDNIEIKEYLNEFETILPIQPRDAFFGGRTEAFKMYKEVADNEKIKYSDFTSLYPFVNKYCKYPLGHPTIVTENFKDLKKYEGIMKCKILPPSDLYIPVLPVKLNNKLLFPLCKTCAVNQTRECSHDEQERALLGVWVTDEIKLAVKKGYKIVRIFEVWHFESSTTYDLEKKTGGLFTEYINTFLKVKQESSGWPSWCNSDESKSEYVSNYQRHEGVILQPSNITTNPGLRALSKLMLNSFWGKFGQRCNLTQTEYVTDPARYFEIIGSDSMIMHTVRYINDEVLHVQWSYDDNFIEPAERTNVILAAYTTAHARIKLYRLMDSLGNRILYADTDSVIYSVRDGEYDPPLGDFLGQLTDELNGDFITHFVSGGPKNYAYKTSRPDSNGDRTHCKVRGITLNYKNSLTINFNSVRDMVLGYGPEKLTVVDDNKITRDQKNTKIVSKKQKKDYKIVFDKRVIVEDFDTVPYGFIPNLRLY